jgi:hypothetical protein
MALAIACWVRDTTIISSQKDLQLNLAMLNCISKTNKVLNTTIPGMDANKQIQMDNNKRIYRDFAWILKG